ncbi:MAG: N-acetylmuramoyl-L-alanine amidase [Blastocatellia bacterium]|nr:N-acetylmuramoyl-L-alanine amidase [Blastocatellia bacterium]
MTISPVRRGLVALGLLMGAVASAQAQRPEVRRSEVRIAAQGRVASIASGAVRVPLEGAAPFLAVGVVWTGEGEAAERATVRLRGSVDGREWSPWRSVDADHDAEGRPGEFVGALSLFDRRTGWVECRVDAAAGLTGLSLTGLRLIFISPGETPAALRERIEERRIQTMSAQQQPTPKYPKPPIVSRTEWGCPDGQITTHGSLSYTTVTHLIVHHTATGNDAPGNDWAAVMRSIWNFHIFTNGWADIGYNYLIDPNGVVYEGRAGGDNVQGAHFSGVNGGTMGVSMIGTFTDVAPPEPALASLRKILAWKADQRGIDPAAKSLHAASGRMLDNISGHRDGPGSTECPGNALYPLLSAVRTGVQTLLTGARGAVAAVSAASFREGALAPESIVAAFGLSLASATLVAETTPLPNALAATSVTVRDSVGVERVAPLFFVSPQQINFLMPAGLANGPASVLVANADGGIAAGSVSIAPIAPALFSAAANGRGRAAAVLLRIKANGAQSYESIETPIDLGPDSDQVFLVAYGTGLRGRASLSATAARIGGLPVETLYAGPVAGLFGLDQLNLRLPRALAGRGEVTLELSVEGIAANPLQLLFK